MAERVVLVCDVCGQPAQASVTFRVGSRSLAQDLCSEHLQELVGRAHAPRRGRRPGAATTSQATARKTASRATPRKAAASKSPAKRPRKRVTNPATLQKRRASLAKARKVLAQKRATAKKSA
jgi:hypothetical protein